MTHAVRALIIRFSSLALLGVAGLAMAGSSKSAGVRLRGLVSGHGSLGIVGWVRERIGAMPASHRVSAAPTARPCG